MNYRKFGATDLNVSEIGFGAWAIGGKSYGQVDKNESLRALALAEELGCNFVDTAMVYGDSELVLGEFLAGRREKWLVATKYSGNKEGLSKTVDEQLKRLKTDVIDFYQIHWVPREDKKFLYDELNQLKKQGKVRYVGVSLYSASDIDFVLDNNLVDGFQIPFSLLDPLPFLQRIEKIRDKNIGVIVRSCLKMGFLTGKFDKNSSFTDPNDQRHKLSLKEIHKLVDSVEKFRFLEKEQGSLTAAAARYPLSFPETSTVILGTKTVKQAEANFKEIPGNTLDATNLSQIHAVQKDLGLHSKRIFRKFAGAVLRRLKSLIKK